MPEEGSGHDVIARVLANASSARSGMRRENGEERPLGKKAARTRDGLLLAAYAVFSERGYQGTSVADIAERAGVSLGTFYQYFRDRADVLGTLVSVAALDLLQDYRRPWNAARGRLGLRRVIASFVENYARTAAFQAVWEEVTHVDDGLASLRRDLTRLFTGAVERALSDGARAGMVRDDVDPEATARALTAMVDRYCYMLYVFDPPEGGPPPVDDTVDTLTALWADAIGLVETASRRAP